MAKFLMLTSRAKSRYARSVAAEKKGNVVTMPVATKKGKPNAKAQILDALVTVAKTTGKGKPVQKPVPTAGREVHGVKLSDKQARLFDALVKGPISRRDAAEILYGERRRAGEAGAAIYALCHAKLNSGKLIGHYTMKVEGTNPQTYRLIPVVAKPAAKRAARKR